MNSTSNKSRLLAALAGLVVLASGSSAFAADQSDAVRSLRVRAGDLNLQSEEGTTALYRRITSAARLVCEQGDIRDLAAQERAHQCERAAIDKAVGSMNSPQLAMLARRANQG